MANYTIEKIIQEIFDSQLFSASKASKLDYKAPEFSEITTIASLLANESSEEELQKFINKNPHFLFRSTPNSGNSNMGLLIKPPIGNHFKADYAIVSYGQGGCGITLIELERSNHSLFTKKLTPAKGLQSALGQITDWHQWIENNKQTFSNTILQLLRRAKKYSNNNYNESFRFIKQENIEESWVGFGGNADFYLDSMVVIGRWSQLNLDERKRLLFLNIQNRKSNIQIRTYDQMIRLAIEGPKMIW